MRGRDTQCARLKAALLEAPMDLRHPGGPGKWLSVREILRLGIAQYNARISELRMELRAEGFEIVNWKDWDEATKSYHSAYRIAKKEIMETVR